MVSVVEEMTFVNVCEMPVAFHGVTNFGPFIIHTDVSYFYGDMSIDSQSLSLRIIRERMHRNRNPAEISENVR